MKINLNFIPQNTTLKGVKNIGLYDSRGNKLKTIPLGNLAPKSTGNILYTFGALSDVHLTVDTGPDDFVRALNYLNSEEKVDFICISGDMGSSGTDAEWANFKAHVDAHSPNTPVYISAGNHDAGQSARKSYDYPIPYTGNPLYYSFTQGDDVFIIFGISLWGDPPFTKESLQWLYETLEANRNKRCFVFEHFMRYNGCGNANGTYYADNLNNTNGKVFLSLMEHYKNVLWFHGHSHTKFNVQEVMPSPIANYDRMFGCHSIHVPGLCYPRDKDMHSFYAESEGYVVDVYKNGIHLRGRDFVAGKFLPIASYWIDTTLTEIAEKSYVDSRGVIDTGDKGDNGDDKVYTNVLPLTIDENGNDFVGANGEDGYITGYRIRSNGILVEEPNTCASGFIPVEKYDIIRVANVTYTGNGTNERVVFYNSSKEFISQMGYTGNSILEKGDVYAFKAPIQGYMRFSANIINEKTIVTINEVITEEKLATNILHLAVNKDGTDFVGSNGEDGYETGYAINGSIVEVEQTDACMTGFIPVTANCMIRVCGIKQWNLSETDGTIDRIVFYDNTKTYISQTTLMKTNGAITMEDDNATYIFDPGYWVSGTAFIRLSTGVIDENTIVTMNEPIIIDTSESSKPSDGITLPEGTTYTLNARDSYSSKDTKNEAGMIRFYIPCEADTTYKLSVENLPIGIYTQNAAGNTASLFCWDMNKTDVSYIQGGGSSSIRDLISAGLITVTNNDKSFSMNLTTSVNAGYIALSLVISTTEDITEEDIKGIVLTLEEPPVVEPPVDTDIIVVDHSKIVLDGRYSQSSGQIVETGGVLGINIDVKPNTTYKLKYTGSITDITAGYDRLYLLNAEGTISTVNGNTSIHDMTQGTVYNSDNTGVEVTFTTYADTTNIWFNILFKEAGQYIKSVDQIANVVCIIQEIN